VALADSVTTTSTCNASVVTWVPKSEIVEANQNRR
jgi:hypothetical protein